VSTAADARPGADRSNDPYLPRHGNGGYLVRHYDLDLDYRIGPNRLDGRASIDAVATHPLSRFSLDLDGLRVAGVTVDGRDARHEQAGGKLRVTPAVPVAAGAAFRVVVRYGGKPRPASGPWGDIGWDELTDGVLVASQPVGAPTWFPCNDHPSDKASYRVAVTTAPAYTVAVTGEQVARTRSGGGTRWVFERAEPTATYLMSVQIGRYIEVNLGGVAATGVPQRAVVPARLRPLFALEFARHDAIMEALQEFFGPYPFGSYTVVVTADALDDPIEAQGMSVFGANHVVGSGGQERLVVHELAHQWFGNCLTVADWRHIWLNEGFATYAEWLWSDLAGGRTVDAHARHWHAWLAERPADLRLADPGVTRMFDQRVYKRGALALHALRRNIGDVVFFTLLRAWVEEHRHGTVITEEFVALAERLAGRPLTDVFRPWLYDKEPPRLT
jgi:aminopeptidase N